MKIFLRGEVCSTVTPGYRGYCVEAFECGRGSADAGAKCYMKIWKEVYEVNLTSEAEAKEVFRAECYCGSELPTDDEAYPPLPLGACVKKNKPCTGDGTLACGAIFSTLVYGP